MGKAAVTNEGFALKNRQKYTASTYDIYDIALKNQRSVQAMRTLFYVNHPPVDVCLCYRQNGKDALVHGIQVSERLLEQVERILRKEKISFTVSKKSSQ